VEVRRRMHLNDLDIHHPLLDAGICELLTRGVPDSGSLIEHPLGFPLAPLQGLRLHQLDLNRDPKS